MVETHTLQRSSIVTTLDSKSLADVYRTTRRASEAICGPLEPEDCCIQSMPDVSPTKWHLAHTSWFFETFVLKATLPDFRSPHPQYDFLFNSYYNSVGRQHARSERGLLSRPTLLEVMDYRAHVDEAMEGLFVNHLAGESDQDLLAVIELGMHHEKQHQELMLMDIKHVFYCNPLRPTYRDLPFISEKDMPPLNWLRFDGELRVIGHDGVGFAYDNEAPQHRSYLEPFQIADRLITCGEFADFIEDGGYERPELWLSDAWNIIQARGWTAPLYWEREAEQWRIMTLGGMRDLNPSEPVCHVSFYEADAYARWMGCWLPRESVWETVARKLPIQGNFQEEDRLHPAPVTSRSVTDWPAQMFGDVWEWTCSPYCAYPGYRSRDGALGEYNGKFMCNQMVLRGGCCATPRLHIRATYRNFFPPDARWPFTGIRLTKESG